jgi:hypothetical protein
MLQNWDDYELMKSKHHPAGVLWRVALCVVVLGSFPLVLSTLACVFVSAVCIFGGVALTFLKYPLVGAIGSGLLVGLGCVFERVAYRWAERDGLTFPKR